MRIHGHRFFSRVVLGGDIGFGEAFMEDEWDSDDVTAVVQFFIRNRDTVRDGRFQTTVASRGIEWLRHVAQRNTLWGSRRNIRRHYDLSNDFFQTFLDDSMAYSCAVYPSAGATLEAAQQHKFTRLIRKARLSANDHVLEIGCGWGGFAIAAARQTGCRITGITVSREQYTLARERVKAAGLEDRIRIEFKDYRHVKGQFDKIVSIEMIESIPANLWPAFWLVTSLVCLGAYILATLIIQSRLFGYLVGVAAGSRNFSWLLRTACSSAASEISSR